MEPLIFDFITGEAYEPGAEGYEDALERFDTLAASQFSDTLS